MSNEDEEVRRGAAALSRRGASKGGHARAERLPATQRMEIARRAAEARWGTSIKLATHDGTLRFGTTEITCAVLEDGTRVINTTTFLNALGRPRKGSKDGGIPFLAAGNLQLFIPGDMHDIFKPIPYRLVQGGRAMGYPAEALPAVCEVYLQAREVGALVPSQRPIAKACEILVRGIARVGIVALIDEATGYQEVRARDELQRILEAYVQAELRPWVKMFPDEFFKEIYRLENWQYRPGSNKRPSVVGRMINKYVYEQLPPGVLEELERRNPKNEHGNRVRRHHQFLTEGTGNPHLDRQISTVTTLMRISNNKTEFKDLFERAFPPPQQRLPLVIDVSEVPPKNRTA